MTSTQALREPECEPLDPPRPWFAKARARAPKLPTRRSMRLATVTGAFPRHPLLRLAVESLNRRHWQIQASVIQSFYYALESLAQRPSYLAGDRKLCKPCNGRTIGYIRSACRLPRLSSTTMPNSD